MSEPTKYKLPRKPKTTNKKVLADYEHCLKAAKERVKFLTEKDEEYAKASKMAEGAKK